jgi:uncharacterized protein YcnI
MSVRTLRRAAAITAASVVAVISVAGPALAHVTVNPGTAEQGGWTKVSFRVPNEQATAATTKLVVNLPQDHPLAFVSVKPVPGWTVKADKTKLAKPIKSDDGEVTEAVTQIVWSGGKIDPGQFQEFDVSVGPLPTDVDQLVFKADQTYSDGTVVKWEDEQTGSEEPEHPAPVLKLTKATTEATGLTATAAPVVEAKTTSASDGTARTLGGLGLAVGVIGLIVGALGFAKGRKSA